MRRTVFAILILGTMAIAAISCTQSNPSTPANSSEQTSLGIATPAATQVTEERQPTSPSGNPSIKPALDNQDNSYTYQEFATGSPGMNTFTAPGPGSSTKADRSYPGAPPTVPHSVTGLSITKDNNSCVSCHSTGMRLGEGHEATRIPESHYTDLQTGEKGTNLVGRRYNCIACHVPQASAEPLVAN